MLRWIRANPALRILSAIIFSSSFLERDIGPAYQLGLNAFVVKPADYDKLLKIVRFLLTWLHHSKLPLMDEKDWVALTARELKMRPHL